MRTKLLMIVSLLCIAALVGGAVLTDTSPTWEQDSWHLMRTVTANDTALTGSTRTWSNCKGLFYPMQRQWEKTFVSFLAYGDGDGAGNPQGGTFSFSIYAIKEFGSAQLVCSGTATVGSLEASHDPATGQAVSPTSNYKWVQIPVLATDAWRTAVAMTGATNDLGNVCWSSYHDWGTLVQITSLTGITSVQVFISGDKSY